MGPIKNVFKEEKLEELLVANWTQFLDSSKLMAFVIQNVRQNIDKLVIVSASEMIPKGVSLTLSRCHWISTGFNLWVEFNIPLSGTEMTEGTIELNLSNNGSIFFLSILGNLYVSNRKNI